MSVKRRLREWILCEPRAVIKVSIDELNCPATREMTPGSTCRCRFVWSDPHVHHECECGLTWWH